MGAAARPDLKLVDPATGELVDPISCPRCARMEAEVEEITRKLKGALLEARTAREEKRARLWGNPDRPKVELLHALHAAATAANPDTPSRRANLSTDELESALSCIRSRGFRRCVAAVVGIAWDPYFGPPGRNGKRPCHNTFDLCFRNAPKVDGFAERAPVGYEPDPERIAAIGGLPVEEIREWLGEAS